MLMYSLHEHLRRAHLTTAELNGQTRSLTVGRQSLGSSRFTYTKLMQHQLFVTLQTLLSALFHQRISSKLKRDVQHEITEDFQF